MLADWLELPGAADRIERWSQLSGLDLARLGSTATAEATTCRITANTSMSELIVHLFFFSIRQHRICFLQLFKFIFRFFLLGIR